MNALPHVLDRTIVIHARPEVVFGFFTDSARWALWWGAGSTIDPRPGGAVAIRYPNAVEASGEVLEIAAPERLVFTFGFASGQPMAPGASRVTITLTAVAQGTRLHLHHAFADPGVCELHVQGWRYQLAVFTNAVSDLLHAAAEGRVDAWFALWAEPDAATLSAQLAALTSDAVEFRDRFSALAGRGELPPHIAASQRFMPGITLQRIGAVRQTQGMALADWRAMRPDGSAVGQGTNVFEFDADGRIVRVTGFWSAPSA
jgi:uncharacterized protein YndB with AHSA1/START domain